MNALYELVGSYLSKKTYEEAKELFDLTNCRIEKDIKECLDSIDGKVKDMVIGYRITPLWGSKPIDDFLHDIKFAFIEHITYGWKLDEEDKDDEIVKLFLPSKRTSEDEFKFITELDKIDYDNGYGIQELFGVVVFNDGTWLNRWEYDGSEGWQRNSIPKEEEYNGEMEKDQ